MKIKIFIIIFMIYGASSSSQTNRLNNKFTQVIIDTLINDEISIRAIIIDKNKVYYAANDNRFGNIDFISKNKFERKVKNDSLKMEFRSIAQTLKDVFILTIGNPAILYKFSKTSNDKKIVYQEFNPKVFYDSMQFYNELDGIAVGDPIDGCLSIITTHDGGNSWQKLPCNNAPKVIDGEAVFAASNTNIVIKNNKTWIVTGGKKARVFLSNDIGLNFKTIETPIIQGQNMTGIFSADFYDDKTGIIVGGNYDAPNSNFDNKAITKNGGKSWKLVSQNMGFGYASCVQYIPNSKGNELVSVGLNGLFYSNDGALSWTKLSDNKNLHTIRFINNNTAIAAGKNLMIKLSFK
jgi:photosystem II stability/assembly factor-like uncharacterized protein